MYHQSAQPRPPVRQRSGTLEPKNFGIPALRLDPADGQSALSDNNMIWANSKRTLAGLKGLITLGWFGGRAVAFHFPPPGHLPTIMPNCRRYEQKGLEFLMKIVGGWVLLLVSSLAACGQEPDDIRLQEIKCPAVAVPAYGRDLVQWESSGHDLTNLVYRVRIADAEGTCTRKNRDYNLYSSLTVTLNATRGPALVGRDITADYFVALMRGDEIFDKQIYSVSGEFPPNTDELVLTGQPIKMTFPISSRVDGSDYTIAVGMQLTQAQIDDNKASSLR